MNSMVNIAKIPATKNSKNGGKKRLDALYADAKKRSLETELGNDMVKKGDISSDTISKLHHTSEINSRYQEINSKILLKTLLGNTPTIPHHLNSHLNLESAKTITDIKKELDKQIELAKQSGCFNDEEINSMEKLSSSFGNIGEMIVKVFEMVYIQGSSQFKDIAETVDGSNKLEQLENELSSTINNAMIQFQQLIQSSELANSIAQSQSAMQKDQQQVKRHHWWQIGKLVVMAVLVPLYPITLPLIATTSVSLANSVHTLNSLDSDLTDLGNGSIQTMSALNDIVSSAKAVMSKYENVEQITGDISQVITMGIELATAAAMTVLSGGNPVIVALFVVPMITEVAKQATDLVAGILLKANPNDQAATNAENIAKKVHNYSSIFGMAAQGLSDVIVDGIFTIPGVNSGNQIMDESSEQFAKQVTKDALQLIFSMAFMVINPVGEAAEASAGIRNIVSKSTEDDAGIEMVERKNFEGSKIGGAGGPVINEAQQVDNADNIIENNINSASNSNQRILQSNIELKASIKKHLNSARETLGQSLQKLKGILQSRPLKGKFELTDETRKNIQIATNILNFSRSLISMQQSWYTTQSNILSSNEKTAEQDVKNIISELQDWDKFTQSNTTHQLDDIQSFIQSLNSDEEEEVRNAGQVLTDTIRSLEKVMGLKY